MFVCEQHLGICARAANSSRRRTNGAPPLKPGLPRALCRSFAGMFDLTQLHNRVYFRSCSRARKRAATVNGFSYNFACPDIDLVARAQGVLGVSGTNRAYGW